MASIINLQDLPQLALEKITSFLNHKQLLALEQVSRKLKSAVDAYFSTTDHLIIGFLPDAIAISYEFATVKDKKCLDGLLNTITRCGMRLRTIQISVTYQHFPFAEGSLLNYIAYFKHFFTSAEASINCPNIEDIIASPNMCSITILDYNIFRQQKVYFHESYIDIYANNIKLYTGATCKLRSIQVAVGKPGGMMVSYEQVLNLYTNLEQIHIFGLDEIFFKFLPQFIEKGLKDLNVISMFNCQLANNYCNILKDLRTLRLGVGVNNNEDIAALNKLQFPKNVELKILIRNVDNCSFAYLNENVCNSIICCDVDGSRLGPTDYSFLNKLKNLKIFIIMNSEQLKVIAEGSFPELRKIKNGTCMGLSILCRNCNERNTCDLHIYLCQLLTDKGNQLTFIDIKYVCDKTMHMVWKALKHCKAAKSVLFGQRSMNSPSTVTFQDVKDIVQLPKLQVFVLSIRQGYRIQGLSANDLLRELMERAVKEQTDFQFEYKERTHCMQPLQDYTMRRIRF